MLDDRFFKILNEVEEEEYRNWARNNYAAGDHIKEVWHPVVRDECKKINEFFKEAE